MIQQSTTIKSYNVKMHLFTSSLLNEEQIM